MPERRIAGSAGSEPEVLPSAQPAAERHIHQRKMTTVARLVMEGRSVYVEIDGRRAPAGRRGRRPPLRREAMSIAGGSTGSELCPRSNPLAPIARCCFVCRMSCRSVRATSSSGAGSREARRSSSRSTTSSQAAGGRRCSACPPRRSHRPM